MRGALRVRRVAIAAALALAPAICPASSPAPSSSDDWQYRIVPGDTLIGIHARWMRAETSWRVVQRLNRIADPRRLRPGSLLRIPYSMLRGSAEAAEVVHVHGEVVIERASGTTEAARAAMRLAAGDTITTGRRSSASIRFADGSRALVAPEARVTIDRHARLGGSGVVDTRLGLVRGGLDAQVPAASPPSRFELSSPVVNLGVRGTEFRGRVSGERTFAEVLEGRVAVGDRTLDAGTGVVATSSGVGPTRTLPGTPDLAAVPSVIARVPLSVAFAPLAGASAYRVRVVAAADPERTIVDGRFERAAAAWDEPVPDGEYRLQVRAIDAEGLEGRVADAPFTLKARPEPPFQLRPRAGDRIASPAVSIAWTRQPEAARYRIQVSADPSFTAARVDRADLDRTEIEVALAPGRYAWRVASIRDTGDVGPWSDPVAFEVVEPPPPPPPAASATPIAAVGSSAETGDEGLVFRWRAVPIEGVRYQVQVAQDPQFREIIVDDTTSATERRLADPRPGAYHVRVRAIGPDGRIGEYGAPQSVEVPARRGWLLLFPLILLLFVL